MNKNITILDSNYTTFIDSDVEAYFYVALVISDQNAWIVDKWLFDMPFFKECRTKNHLLDSLGPLKDMELTNAHREEAIMYQFDKFQDGKFVGARHCVIRAQFSVEFSTPRINLDIKCASELFPPKNFTAWKHKLLRTEFTHFNRLKRTLGPLCR